MLKELKSEGMKFKKKDMKVFKNEDIGNVAFLMTGDGESSGVLVHGFVKEYNELVTLYYKLNAKTNLFEVRVYDSNGEHIYDEILSDEYFAESASEAGIEYTSRALDNCDGIFAAISLFGCNGACAYLVLNVPWINEWCGPICSAGVLALYNCICNGNCGAAPVPALECGGLYQPNCE